jgi:hypothetical protein
LTHKSKHDILIAMMNQLPLPKQDMEIVDFGDKRLNKRLQQSMDNLTKNARESILGAQGSRSDAKAFYRLLGNEKFDIEKLADAARRSTISRMEGTVLLIEDTAEINLGGHKKTKGLGYSSAYVRGVRLHSCIATTPEGLPLGLVAQSYATRPMQQATLTREQIKRLPIEDKESFRWLEMLDESTMHIPPDIRTVTICDREGDFYELYAQAQGLGKDFVIRVSQDRPTESDEKSLSQIRRTKACGRVTITIPRNASAKVAERQAEMEVAHCTLRIKKPQRRKEKSLPDSLELRLVRITEINPDNLQEPIEWILATNLPVSGADDVMTIVGYYVQRWKIERFHFVLKSGCGVEKIQQRTYEKIKSMLLIYSVIAMFIMSVTYLGRVLPETPCNALFQDDEWQMLYRIVHKTNQSPSEPYPMADAVRYLGELGGYRRAPSDGPPGLKAVWSGLFKLSDFLDLFVGQV